MWCDRSRIDLFIYLMIYLLSDVIFALLLYNYSYISFQTFASIMFYYLHIIYITPFVTIQKVKSALKEISSS